MKKIRDWFFVGIFLLIVAPIYLLFAILEEIGDGIKKFAAEIQKFIENKIVDTVGRFLDKYILSEDFHD